MQTLGFNAYGVLVISMTLLMPQGNIWLAALTVLVAALYSSGYGAPVHVGDPKTLVIMDLQAPDFGVVPPMGPDDVPVFWACGVTPQQLLPQLQSAYCISHYPGHMLVLDQRPEAFASP